MNKHSFISITKAELIRKLREKKIRPKYHNQICNGVKEIIEQALDDFVEQSIEQNRIIEGQESLEKYE